MSRAVLLSEAAQLLDRAEAAQSRLAALQTELVSLSSLASRLVARAEHLGDGDAGGPHEWLSLTRAAQVMAESSTDSVQQCRRRLERLRAAAVTKGLEHCFSKQGREVRVHLPALFEATRGM